MASRPGCAHWVAAGLAVAWLAGIMGCTSAPGPPGRPATASARAAVLAPAVRPCRTLQIRSAIRQFVVVWDRHDRQAFGQLFGGKGELDMATKRQDTLHHGAWSSAVGASQVAAFAARQWLLGETLSYYGMTIYISTVAPTYLGGAELNQITARFADGTSQPIEEAKFNYNCLTGEFTHVVIISAGIATKA